jgi:hypothetical protein
LLVGLTGYVLSNIIFLYSASIGLLGYVSGFFLLLILLASLCLLFFLIMLLIMKQKLLSLIMQMRK